MAWRPSSPRRDALQALRRVVESPPGSPTVDTHHGDRAGASAMPEPGGGGRVALAVRPAIAAGPDTGAPVHGGLHANTRAGTAASPARTPARRRRGARRPLPASQPEPSHRQPDRAPRGVITSTPATGADVGSSLPEITPQAATISAPPMVRFRPPAELAGLALGPAAPRHTAEGPWTTAPDAPGSTPTWLRSTPDRAGGGMTAVATGTAATRSGPTRAPTHPRSRPAWEVCTSLLVCLGLWTLVDSPALARAAASSQIGTRRAVALAVLRPIVRASAALSLDRVSHASDAVLGRHRRSPEPLPPVRLPPAVRRPATPAEGPEAAAPRATAPPEAVPLRVPTTADPLRVLVVGDSIALSFGQGVAAKLDGAGLAKTTVDAREGTGLARPDSFDWPAQVRADLAQFHPEVVVAMFGGNDDQDFLVGGRYITFASPAWQQLYAARVAQVAGEVSGAGARLAWAGLPLVRSSAKTARFAQVMAVARGALVDQAGVLWVDNAGTLADAAGHYQAVLPDASGQQVVVREPDGVHPTPAGARRLADRAIVAMTAAWRLNFTPAAVPPPPPVPVPAHPTIGGIS